MFITILCVLCSQALDFDHLTLPILFNWYCGHPFLFMFMICELASYARGDNQW